MSRIAALTNDSSMDHGAGHAKEKNIRTNDRQPAKTNPHHKPLNQVANTIGKRKKMVK
jgi:hypothetical protein